MHEINPSLISLQSVDPWSLTLEDLERAAVALMGDKTGGWVRRNNAVKIAERHRPPDVAMLSAAIEDLGTRARAILALGGRGAALRAVAYWHLRFEDLHPLRDGNGRIGRLFLAVQCESASRFRRDQILTSLGELENEYRWVFVPEDQSQRFELLLDIVGRITGTPLPDDAFRLPITLEPLVPLGRVRNQITRPAPFRPQPMGRSFYF